MALADVVHEVQEPSSAVWSSKAEKELQSRVVELQGRATEELKKEGFDDESICHELYLNMRYQGTDTALMMIKPDNDWNFGKAFVDRHHQEFGFTLPDRDVLVDDIRVRGIGQSFEGPEKTVDQQLKELKQKDVQAEKKHSTQKVYFEGGAQDTNIFVLDKLEVGDKIRGPAIIIDETQTIVVVPHSTAIILKTHVVINLGESEGTSKKANTEKVDPIILSIFSHRFMAIAEQMGRALQKPTSKSVSITVALYSMPMAVLSLTLLIFQSILDRCLPPSKSKLRYGVENSRREMSLSLIILRLEEHIYRISL
jgi:5-oxoprolinase (ATP-hydrolysing)